MQASEALRRVNKGGVLEPAKLKAVASTIVGAMRLQRAVVRGAKTARGLGYYSTFYDLLDPLQVA